MENIILNVVGGGGFENVDVMKMTPQEKKAALVFLKVDCKL